MTSEASSEYPAPWLSELVEIARNVTHIEADQARLADLFVDLGRFTGTDPRSVGWAVVGMCARAGRADEEDAE
jgi:hypothetical protein